MKRTVSDQIPHDTCTQPGIVIGVLPDGPLFRAGSMEVFVIEDHSAEAFEEICSRPKVARHTDRTAAHPWSRPGRSRR